MLLIILLIVLFLNGHASDELSSKFPVEVDRLAQFYKRITNSDVEFCADKTRLMPDCKECIPGLKVGQGSSTCNEFVPSSLKIREEIQKLTRERYPMIDSNRPFGLYPYLEMPQFMQRQKMFGKMLGQYNAKHILDIGAYYNPINLFFSSELCPLSVVVIEPILDALSVVVPCGDDTSNNMGAHTGGKNTKTHVVFLPITFRYYAAFVSPHNPADGNRRLRPDPTQVTSSLPHPDHVVCIGCDSHYGPNRKLLEGTFLRPFTLLLEYPVEYVHNRPYRMMGEALGEKTVFKQSFDYRTNETRYTKRQMIVIEYTQVSDTL